MRSDKITSRSVAEIALYWPQNSGGGSGEPAPTELRYVAPSGSDVSGNGSLAAPYATVQGALNSITDATSLKPYTVVVAPGTFDGNVALKPFVSVSGVDPSAPPTFDGNVTIAPGFTNGATTGLANVNLGAATTTLDFGTTTGAMITLNNIDNLTNTLNITAESVLGNIAKVVNSRLNDANLTALSSLTTQNNKLSGTTVVHAPNATVWNGANDAILGPLTVLADAGKTLDANLVGSTISPSSGSLTLNGAGVNYIATALAIPPDVTLLNGAPPPATAPVPGSNAVDFNIAFPNNNTASFPYADGTYNLLVSICGRVTAPGDSGGAVGDSLVQLWGVPIKVIAGVATIIITETILFGRGDASLTGATQTFGTTGNALTVEIDMSGTSTGEAADWQINVVSMGFVD